MSKQLGSLVVPIYSSLPVSAPTGAIGMCAGVISTWTGSAWAQLVPVYMNTTGTPPSVGPGLPFLYVDMSGTDAVLYAEDGVIAS